MNADVSEFPEVFPCFTCLHFPMGLRLPPLIPLPYSAETVPSWVIGTPIGNSVPAEVVEKKVKLVDRLGDR